MLLLCMLHFITELTLAWRVKTDPHFCGQRPNYNKFFQFQFFFKIQIFKTFMRRFDLNRKIKLNLLTSFLGNSLKTSFLVMVMWFSMFCTVPLSSFTTGKNLCPKQEITFQTRNSLKTFLQGLFQILHH